MGCKCCSTERIQDLKEEIQNNPKIFYENRNEDKNNNHKRKNSLSTKNNEDEFDDESELDKSMIIEQNQNLNFKKSDVDCKNEEKDINFDEQKARDLVNILLEDDVSFYKNLLPKINLFSYQDFKNLFEGNCEHNYNTTNKAQIIRLAHKFDNFYFILENSYREKILSIFKRIMVRISLYRRFKKFKR